MNKKKREKAPKKYEFEKPGAESYRKTREDLTTMDKLHMALTELCFAINYCSIIKYGLAVEKKIFISSHLFLYSSVWEYTFAPREYLHQHLETRFSRALAGMVMYR